MKRILVIIAGIVFITQASAQTGHKVDVAAYIWPSCHHDERFGDMLWPEGNGEWEVIQKGTPRFEGHYQPKRPLWGYEHDDDPKVFERWIDAATDHGVNVFIFDWYWYDDGPFLESALNNGFLKAPNNQKMKFYIMWANHNVRRSYWNVHKFEGDNSLLWDAAVDVHNFEIIVDRVIQNYFKQPNYYTIDGQPVFSIFSLDNFIKGLGGMEKAANALDYFREETRKAGFPGLHIQLIAWGSPDEEIKERIEVLGINSVTKYNWGWTGEQNYVEWGSREIDNRESWDSALSIPYFPNASIGWDDTPRFPNKDKEDIVYYHRNPQTFANYLHKAKQYCEERPEQPGLITIFAWNEWVEGAYLLPDMRYGFDYLKAVERVMKAPFDPYE